MDMFCEDDEDMLLVEEEPIKTRVKDLTYEQIATVLDCTKAQVRTWIFRARRQLSDELAKRGLLGEEL